MLYKVYVNLCDFRVGSYVTLGTRATCHWDDLHQIFLHLVYWYGRFGPFLVPFWGAEPFVTLGASFE